MTRRNQLTTLMKTTLKDVAFGVRKYGKRFYCTDEPEKYLDGRSLEALQRRGLINWFGDGGATHQIHVEPTAEGWQVFSQLLEQVNE